MGERGVGDEKSAGGDKGGKIKMGDRGRLEDGGGGETAGRWGWGSDRGRSWAK